MPEYSSHMRLLVLGLFVLLFLFLLSAALQFRAFLSPLVYSITVIVLSMLILARFGGDRGQTL